MSISLFKSKKQAEACKILFQFVLMLIASFFGGIFFVREFGINFSYKIWDKALLHFSHSHASGATPTHIINDVLSSSLIYVISLLLIFIFSFSFINYLVTDILLATNGFCAGLCITLVYICRKQIGIPSFLAFTLFVFASLITVFFFALRMAIYSLELKLDTANGRMRLEPRLIARIALTLLSTLGTLVLLGFLHCLILF